MADPWSVAGLPGSFAQPPFSTNSPCDQASVFFSVARVAAALGALSKRSRHAGARAETTAASARRAALLSAVPPVTQPPQLNPTTAMAIAPPTAPQKAG